MMIFPIIVAVAYLAGCVYTDVKYRITKNMWHLVFAVIALAYSTVFGLLGGFAGSLITMVLTVFVGINLFERIHVFCPGDTKMLAVGAAWVHAYYIGNGGPTDYAIAATIAMWAVVHVVFCVVNFIRKRNFKEIISYPGAVTIAPGVLLAMYFGRLIVL